MTPISHLRALLAQGTKRPWASQHSMNVAAVESSPRGRIANCNTCPGDDATDEEHYNAQVIVAAVNALPELLDEIEALRASLRYLRRKIDGYDSTFEHCGFDEFKEEP